MLAMMNILPTKRFKRPTTELRSIISNFDLEKNTIRKDTVDKLSDFLSDEAFELAHLLIDNPEKIRAFFKSCRGKVLLSREYKGVSFYLNKRISKRMIIIYLRETKKFPYPKIKRIIAEVACFALSCYQG